MVISVDHARSGGAALEAIAVELRESLARYTGMDTGTDKVPPCTLRNIELFSRVM